MPEVPVGARRVGVAFARLPGWLDGFADRHGPLEVEAGAERLLLTAADGSRAWLDVPFGPWRPPESGPLTALQLHLNRTRRVGVLLVRRGGYAAGVFAGAQLLSSKVGTAYVQGTTKAGGWSQQRYARRRANQSRAAFAEAADVAARILLPERSQLDALICGGDQGAITQTLADPRLAPLLPLRCPPFLPVPDPRLKVLQATPEQFLVLTIHLVP
ncbi:MAG TPA: acVLRF1 family peptidyl-tRNA hydrolase [Jatrophihabitans sp.]|nr:acVLRF1 family peptidyl-tRNA hydrolase [Jatrophihabitans sp.]